MSAAAEHGADNDNIVPASSIEDIPATAVIQSTLITCQRPMSGSWVLSKRAQNSDLPAATTPVDEAMGGFAYYSEGQTSSLHLQKGRFRA